MSDEVKPAINGPGYRVRPSARQEAAKDQRLFQAVAESPVIQNRAVIAKQGRPGNSHIV